MKVVLVTGASGFLGCHAVPALQAREFEVHGLSRHPPKDRMCSWHAVDLFDGTAVAKILEQVRPSHLLHLAWETTHGTYWTSPENLRWVEATLGLVRQFHAFGGRRAACAGTCAEYTWDDEVLRGRPIAEGQAPREPGTFYGGAKNATFELLTAYCRAVRLAFAWGRVFFAYGSHERPATLIPSIIQSLRNGKPVLCTHGRQVRDFVHASDVGAAFAALVDSQVDGAVNIASGIGTPIGDVATRLGSLLGRPDLIRLGALEPRPNEPAHLVADTARLSREVGFRPAMTLEQGLREAIGWWAQQPAGC